MFLRTAFDTILKLPLGSWKSRGRGREVANIGGWGAGLYMDSENFMSNTWNLISLSSPSDVSARVGYNRQSTWDELVCFKVMTEGRVGGGVGRS